ncbi:MAG: hypothetical protein ACU83N_09595, partial [Gammaproteobacteria bacterium]
LGAGKKPIRQTVRSTPSRPAMHNLNRKKGWGDGEDVAIREDFCSMQNLHFHPPWRSDTASSYHEPIYRTSKSQSFIRQLELFQA